MTSPEERSCELCIVGMGVAGLNALFAASVYLTSKQRVILIEKNPTVGGMWTETYDYVRLHQPHPMFTAGNIPWDLDRDRSHLATKGEVLAHFRDCLETLRKRVDLVDLFGVAYLEHREVPTGDHYSVEVVCRAADDSNPLRIRAKRLIKAFGYRIPQNEPLSFTSNRVHSVSPHSAALRGPEMAASDKPVLVVGGGKTGMDTAHELIQKLPGRKIQLVAGSGTVFLNRNRAFPTGTRRWWGGNTSFRIFRELATTYDGDNEDDVIGLFKQKYAIGLREDCKQYMFGTLSEEENTRVSEGLDQLFMDYVSDVVDIGADTKLVFRSGHEVAVEPGSWFVNCTGHLMREAPRPYEPYLSEHGVVVSIQPTSAIHFLTSVASYFLVHLFFLEKLSSLPLYELNQQDLVQKNKRAWSSACATHAFYNTLLIVDAVPARVMREFGLNFDLWFPAHRRLLDFARLKRNASRDAEHCKKALDRVRERYGIQCGVLAKPAAPEAL